VLVRDQKPRGTNKTPWYLRTKGSLNRESVGRGNPTTAVNPGEARGHPGNYGCRVGVIISPTSVGAYAFRADGVEFQSPTIQIRSLLCSPSMMRGFPRRITTPRHRTCSISFFAFSRMGRRACQRVRGREDYWAHDICLCFERTANLVSCFPGSCSLPIIDHLTALTPHYQIPASILVLHAGVVGFSLVALTNLDNS